MALTGEMNRSFGSTPLVVGAPILALSADFATLATLSLATTTAAAPSLICEALPAVAVPSGGKAGGGFARSPGEQFGRGPSSCTIIVSLLPYLMPTGTISCRNLPAAWASIARRWL